MGARQLQTSRFHVDVHSIDRQLVLKFDGILDEEVPLQELKVGPESVIVFDLLSLRLLSPAGIRSWTHFMRGLERRDPRPVFVFRNCSKVFIDHVNIVLGFLPVGAMIESFYVPYRCACGFHQHVLFESGLDFRQATADVHELVNGPESVPCPSCGGMLHMDVPSTRYFNILKYRP